MLIKKFESIMKSFCVAFSRKTTFYCFILICFGFIVRDDHLGVTSFIRALGLHPSEYKNILSFFCYSHAYSIYSLCSTWFSILKTRNDLYLVNEKILLIVDGLKIPKAGWFMPAKRLHHQESKNKPKFIMGHYFGAIGAVISKNAKYFCVPICFQIQDGLRFAPNSKETLTSKMFNLISIFTKTTKVCILCDAFFVAMKHVNEVKAAGHDLIGRVKISTVAYKVLGKDLKERIKLKELFDKLELFTEKTIRLYGKIEKIKLYHLDLFYHGLTVRFVLTIFKDGKIAIFLSTNILLTPIEIIQTYAIRFKIEVSFKALIYSIGGFLYHFWSKYIRKIKSGQKNMYLHKADPYDQMKIKQKVEAYNRFVCIAGIVLGILQIMAVEFGKLIINKNPFYFKTMPKTEIPSEYMVRKTIKEMHIRSYLKIRTTPVLGKVMRLKKCSIPDKDFWI